MDSESNQPNPTEGTMPLDNANVNTTIDPMEAGSTDTVCAMSTGKDIPETFRRLTQILERIGKSESDLYRETALSQGYISKLKGGKLGKIRPQLLAMEMFRTYGVPFDVWTGKRLDWNPKPQNSYGPATEGGPEMGVMVGQSVPVQASVDLRRELMKLAIDLNEPDETLQELCNLTPPVGATEAWWLRTYSEIVQRTRKTLRK